MRRATILSPSRKSEMNMYAPSSEPSTLHPISADHTERLIIEIIDQIFDEYKGTVDISSSECSSVKLKPTVHKWDRRLKLWQDVLSDRLEIDHRIQKATKKRRHEVLFNRLATVDEQDKRTIQRILDYVERLDPVRLMTIKKLQLKEKLTRETCLTVSKVDETLPRTERKAAADLAITGMPAIVRQELLGKTRAQGEIKPHAWLKSEVLQEHLEDLGPKVHRVVDFYPDIDKLQIVGQNIFHDQVLKHDSDIQVLKTEKILKISSDTSIDNIPICPPATEDLDAAEPVIEYGISINDNIFLMKPTRSSKTVQVERSFVATPFTRKVKQILCLKNIGEKCINFEWAHRSYYAKESSLLKACDNEFLFDTKPFRLYANETRTISVLYQPRRVDVVKSKWYLKVDPQFFCRKLDGIVVNLFGFCPPPVEYENKLRNIQRMVLEKSNRTMVNKLTTGLASIVPLLKPVEVPCPYRRTLNDMELFEQLNDGYRCERYHDLELLRELHKRIKKPREPLWDLRIDTIKCTIVRILDPTERALALNELLSIIEPMKGRAVDLETRLQDDPERERSKLLFVRGTISSAIDEWEEMTLTLEDAHLKSAIPAFVEELRQYIERNAEEEENTAAGDDEGKLIEPYPSLSNIEEVYTYVLNNRVRKMKAFKDCLYVQTYSLICDFVENMVNVVESADAI